MTVLLLLVPIAIAAAALIVSRRRTGAPAPPAATVADKSEPLGHEITRLRVAEQEWPGAEERFRTPVDQVENYAIILLDTQGRPTSWNTGIRRVLGYDKSDFLRTTAADLYPEDARESGVPEADLAEAAQRGRSTIDRWLVRKDGSRFWGSVSTTSVHDRDGRLLGFARRLRDLSESRKVEEQQRRRQDSLELALEAAGLGTWECDLATETDAMDARAKVLFGIAPEETLTRGRWVEAIHPDDRVAALERWERAVAARSGYSAEYRVVWPDGTVHTLMSVGRCVTDPETGAATHFTGVVLDLTERRRTEEHLQESLRLEAVGRLAGGIAHDLNNMLAAILGFGDMLSRSFEPGDPRAADVEQITRAASRSAGLTRQLLAFARRELIQPRPLDLNAVVQHVQALLPPILGENVELELKLASDLGVVYADARQIEQTVMNLVLNARDALPQGGRVTIETGTVTLEPGIGIWPSEEERAAAGRFTMLAVTDTGTGMDSATLQRIWEPFFTTKPPGKGTGLGLSSVYGAAKQSGGFVWADSEPGRGTSVQVYWPEIRAELEPVEPAASMPLVNGTETVLIVEDEELVRALAVRALRTFGYICHSACNAPEALQMLEALQPAIELVVTDVVMPGMSGRDLGERIARLYPGIPVVYTSAFSEDDVVRRGLLEADRPFLQKPFTPQELARAVRDALDLAGKTA
jgi:two-component system, cell cycle sensor histidine kinase and response regulator CckA